MATKSGLNVDPKNSDGSGLVALECPRCHETHGLHFDQVIVGGAGGVVAQVDAHGEDDTAIPAVSVTTPEHASEMAKQAQRHADRRHYIKLIGWCENCGPGHLGLVFKQHKGTTYFGLTALPDPERFTSSGSGTHDGDD